MGRLPRLAHGLRAAALGLAAAALLLAAGPAEAQVNLLVATSPGTPPVANAVTRGQASSISFDVTNVRSGQTLRQLQLRLPLGYYVTGGVGPPGWTVTGITNLFRTITFRVSDCGVGGLATGASGTFRVDAVAPNTQLAADATDALGAIVGTDPCNSPSGWTEPTGASVTWARKALRVTGSVTPSSGAPPLAATATYTVTNLSSGTRTVTLAPTVTPATGFTGGCTPASRSLGSSASGTFTCSYTFESAGTYALGATATGTNGTSAVGAWAGTVLVGSATATFAFDTLVAGAGDQVRATLTVRNAGASALTVTPPGYGALVLQNLARASGTTDPAAVVVAAGESAQFVYALDVTGAVGASFVAQGAATTDLGPTNLAVTPAGTVSASRVEWTPPAVVPSRSAPPYGFAVTVANGSATSVSEVRVVNPQNATWTGLANVGASGLAYTSRSTNGATTYLRYTGTLAPGATATLHFSFTGVPAVSQTTRYPFQVLVYQTNGGSLVATYSISTAVAVPIPDVGQPSVLSRPDGQLLSWVNTARADAVHEGVVVFRTAAGVAPTVPADFVDYTVAANRPADFLYADGERSTAAGFWDGGTVGAYNYRICNYDALLVYSSCSTGFTNGAGYLDSAVVPAGGWAHQLGGMALLLPSVAPGGLVGVTTNAPSIAVLDVTTGERVGDPVALSALPSNGSAAAPLTTTGRSVLFAADTGGRVIALDVGTGALAWPVLATGESFVAGPYVLPLQYAAPAFQATYQRDVAFVAGTSGAVLALDAATGDVLWTLPSTGFGVRARLLYDAGTNRLFVPTDGGGVLAYDLGTSATYQDPPSQVPGWSNPGGTFRTACRPATATEIACADTSGQLLVLAKLDGAVTGSVATLAASPSTVTRVNGTSPGYVVSSASRVVRVVPQAAPPYLRVQGSWAPGLTLSPALALTGEQAIIVGASDKRLHKLSLADATDTGQALEITSQLPSMLVGPPAVDVQHGLFVFGTEDGRVWAVPPF